MDQLEKADRLRKRANVTYEEAAAALEASGGDLLDAMVLLEKQGKTAGPQNTVYSTSFQEQHEYIDVPKEVAQQKKAAPTLRKIVSRAVHAVIRFVRGTSFRIERKGKELVNVPSWVILIVVAALWRAIVPIILVSLVFGFRYSFTGSVEEAAETANSFLEKASEYAEEFKNDLFRKKKKVDDTNDLFRKQKKEDDT